MIDPNKIPTSAVYIAERLHSKGFRTWIVGGCVRDLILGREVSDWDLTTDATPEQVMEAFPKVIPTGIEHGTVTVRHYGESFEVTTLRGEGAYSDGRHPDSVHFVKDLDEDLARRDFTMNAIAADPITGKIFDPFGGVVDLQKKVVRCVGDPMQRFAEDGLRILRAARFCATLGFDLERKTEAAIVLNVETFQKVSTERVHAEFVKMFTKADMPSRGLKIMERTGLLEVICPVLSKDTLLTAADGQKKDFVLRMATLLHDGEVSADDASLWLHTFKVSNADRERIVRILRMYNPAYNMTHREWRIWASQVGREHVQDLLDCYWPPSVHATILNVIKDVPLNIRELAVNGHDLLAIGLSPKEVGHGLRRALIVVLEDPTKNTKEALLDDLKRT